MRPVRHGAAILRLAEASRAELLTDEYPDTAKQLAAVARRPQQRQAALPTDVLLRVLATTDLHANILSYDYAANRPLNGLGLAQMASLIAAAQRAEAPGASGQWRFPSGLGARGPCRAGAPPPRPSGDRRDERAGL